jgi:uncharacterized protein (DUF4415 family)
MRKIVRRTMTPPSPLTAEPEAPQGKPPPLRDWTEAPLPLPKGKRLISLRIDAEVLEYFQAGGKGYQTRINAVLRAFMQARKGRHS